MNLFNVNTWKLMIKQDYSLMVLITSLVFSLVFKRAEFMLIYLMVLVLRTILKNKIKYLPYFLLRDIIVLIGAFTFFPKNNHSIKYNKI